MKSPLLLTIALCSLLAVAVHAATPAQGQAVPAAGDPSAGAKLVQQNGCEGCHGAGLKGGTVGPRLYGIERKLSPAQIADFIKHPRSPMPDFGFTDAQIADLVAYVSSLDGGANADKPVATFDPATPKDGATITVRFPGTPPKSVVAVPVMQMGKGAMNSDKVVLTPSPSDAHVFTGKLTFGMGGPWIVRLQYDGHTMDIPVTVGS